jgi:hypothetical protein
MILIPLSTEKCVFSCWFFATAPPSDLLDSQVLLILSLVNLPYTNFYIQWKMQSSGMWSHVALVGTDVSEECRAYIIRVTRIGELGTSDVTMWAHIVFLCSMCQLLVTANVVPSSLILVTLMTEALRSSETSVLTRDTQLLQYTVLSHGPKRYQSNFNFMSQLQYRKYEDNSHILLKKSNSKI